MKYYRVMLLLGALAGAGALVAHNRAVRAATPTPTAAAASSTTTLPTIIAQATVVNGLRVGQVLVGNTVALRLYDTVAGISPGDRASIVATRLQDQLRLGYGWQDVKTGTQDGEAVLLMGDNVLVTADRQYAASQGVTPGRLVGNWRDALQSTLRGAGVVASRVADGSESWPAWTNPKTKIVPVLAAGTPGVSLGAAQVTGPSDRVDNVKAVLQLSLEFQKTARVYVYVPSSSITGLSRVQGTAVSALLQYTVFRF
jgi:hypothetical protein